MEKKETDISQILVDYGVYNQSGINAMKLDKELRKLVDKAREEGREEIRQLLRDKKQMQKFLKKNPKFYKGKKIETAGVATLTKF